MLLAKGKPYRIYYPNPTMETMATAVAIEQNIPKQTVKVATQFVEYLTQPEQRKVFVKYGFRPITSGIDLSSVPNSPRSQNIPGAMPDLSVTYPKTL